MRSHYELAIDFMRRAEFADTPEQATILMAQAQVHATLALVDATRETR